MSKSSATVESLMDDYTDLWNGDFSNLDVVAEGVYVYHDAAPEGVVHGRDALESFIREFHAAFPDFEIVVDDWIGRGDLAMKEWTMTGTHEGEFNGIPPTGREIESKGMATVVFADGRVQEDRLFYNPQIMAEQLGLPED